MVGNVGEVGVGVGADGDDWYVVLFDDCGQGEYFISLAGVAE